MIKLLSIFMILKLRFKLWNFKRVQKAYEIKQLIVLKIIEWSMKKNLKEVTAKFKELLLLLKENQMKHQQIFVLSLINKELKQAMKL